MIRMQYVLLLVFLVSSFIIVPGGVFAQETKMDLVLDQVQGDFDAIDQFYLDTQTVDDPEVIIEETKELEQRLDESIELYEANSEFANEVDQQIAGEVRQMTDGIREYRRGLLIFREGVANDNQAQIMEGYEQLDTAEAQIQQGYEAFNEKAEEFGAQDSRNEIIYIGLTVMSAVITAVFFILSRKPASTVKDEVRKIFYGHLTKTSLAPLAGSAITLGTFEYAKWSGGGSYTIVWGLVLIGFAYFLKDLFSYMTVHRPRIAEMSDSELKQVYLGEEAADSSAQKESETSSSQKE